MVDFFTSDLLSYGLPIHVVLDGAIVPDIETHLKHHGLFGRPLFRDTMDKATILAGPWLVSPGLSHELLAHSVAAAREAGQGVFWLSNQSQEELFKHLRILSAVRMPDEQILYFRHYDSDVLASIVPLLEADQASTLFGHAEVIAFIGGCGDGATVEKPDSLPYAASNLIAFKQWQIDVLDNRQSEISRRKIGALMRQEYPEQTRDFSDAVVAERALFYQRSANELNLTSEIAIINWMRLNLENNDGASKNEILKHGIAKISVSQTNDVFVKCIPNLLEEARKARKMREGLKS